MAQKKLEVRGVDLSSIKNRNEKRVAALVGEILDEYYENYIFEHLDIQDIYALTLNLLPARYAQTGSIILSDVLSDYEIRNNIRIATERVLDNPTRSDS